MQKSERKRTSSISASVGLSNRPSEYFSETVSQSQIHTILKNYPINIQNIQIFGPFSGQYSAGPSV